MRRIGLLALGLAAFMATGSCKRKDPEPIPGPKAGAAVSAHFRASGIAYFQGGLEEGFARARDEQDPRCAKADPALPRGAHLPPPSAEMTGPARPWIHSSSPVPHAPWYNPRWLGL
jgi:hypothetical protein